jgi:hypothetical protein
MSNRNLYMLGATIGGILGGLLPNLWGANDFSGQGILLSTLGGFAGLWLAYKYTTS